MTYAWVEQHKADWSVRLTCEVLGVSASGYFENGRRKGAAKQSPPDGSKRINDEALLVHIKAIHAKVREE